MSGRAVIPAAIITAPTPERQHFVDDSYPHSRSSAGPSRSYHVTYGAVSNQSSPGSRKGKEPRHVAYEDEEGDDERYEIESCDSGVESLVDSKHHPRDTSGTDARLMSASVTWRHMSRRYLLVPVITLLFFAALVALVTFAW